MTKDQLDILYNIIFLVFCGLGWLISAFILWKRPILTPARVLLQPPPITKVSFLHVFLVFAIYVCWLIAASLVNDGIVFYFPDWAEISHGSVVWSSIIDSLAKLGTLPFIVVLLQLTVVGGFSKFGLGRNYVAKALPQGLKSFGLLIPWVIWVAIATSIISSLIRHGGEAPKHPILSEMGKNHSLLEQGVLLFIAVVMAPVTEELFFRGLIHAALHRIWDLHMWVATDPGRNNTINVEVGRWGISKPVNTLKSRWGIILISSVLFASVHGSNGWEAVIIIFPLALGLGLVYELTGNLWACMVVHAIFNGVNLWLNSLNIK